MAYRIEQRVSQNDFDPALELKRLRQELIERLLIIQRKAAINASSEKHAQLSITIDPTQKQFNHTNNQNNESPQHDKIYHNTNTNCGIAPNNLENSAERIMANIESARECISKLQVPNLSQPLPKLKTNKQNEQHNKNITTQLTPNKINNHSKHNSIPIQNRQTLQPQIQKNDFINETFGISFLHKLNIGLSIIGVAGILLGTLYLFNNNTNNIQPGVPVLFVGLILIVAGITGHLLQEYTNNNSNVSNRI
jgi:hypothetical protein